MTSENSERSHVGDTIRSSVEGLDLKKSQRNINVIIKSFDAKVLDETAKRISDTLDKIGLEFSGPIPLPKITKRFIVLKSPHVNKDARQTFEINDMKRLIQIPESKSAVAALHGMTGVHPSVNIEIKFSKIMPKHKKGGE